MNNYHPPHQRFESIQIARFFAALSVIALHLSQYAVRDFGLHAELFHIGGAGVDLFFIISGFIIARISDQPGLRGLFFFSKRLTRIAPLYYLCTLLVFMLAVNTPELLHISDTSAGDLLKSLLFIPYEKSDGKLHPIFFLGWTLNYEMFFYLLTTIAVMAFRRRGILAVAVALLILTTIGYMNAGSKNLLIRFYCNGILLNFAYGLIIYSLYQTVGARLHRYSWLWIPGVLLISIQIYLPVPLPREFAFGLPAALIVSGLIGLRPQKGTLFRSLVQLGDASYSTYLLHPFILQANATLFIALGLTSSTSIAVYVLISMALIIPASLLSFHYVEQLSRHKLNRWLGLSSKNQAQRSPIESSVVS